MWKSPGGWWGDGTHFNFGCLAFRGELRSNLELDKENTNVRRLMSLMSMNGISTHGHLNNWGVAIQGYVMHIDEIPPITGPEKLLGSGCGCDLRLGILPTYWDAPSMKIPQQWTQKGTDPILGDRFERIWYQEGLHQIRDPWSIHSTSFHQFLAMENPLQMEIPGLVNFYSSRTGKSPSFIGKSTN